MADGVISWIVNGVADLIDPPPEVPDSNPPGFQHDLYWIKTNGVPFAEVYEARARDNYERGDQWQTGLAASDARDGTVVIYGKNLWFMKFGNSTGDVHMARFTRSSGYKSIDFMVRVPGLSGEDVRNNGKVMICNSDLYFIKLRNTGTKTIELHRWTAKSKFQSHDFGSGTRFKDYEASNGQFSVCWTEANWWHTAYTEGHSAFLTCFDKTKDKIRVRKTGGASEFEPNSFRDGWAMWEDFSQGDQRVPGVDTFFPAADGNNGEFFMSGNHKLYYMKTNIGNLSSGVEVHMVNRSNDEHKNFVGDGYHRVSRFGSSGVALGTFCIDLIA